MGTGTGEGADQVDPTLEKAQPGGLVLAVDRAADLVEDHLGAAPDGPVRFRYAVIAGEAGEPAPVAGIANDAPWWVARAIGDLDEDGTTFYVQMTSETTRQFNSASGTGGWE